MAAAITPTSSGTPAEQLEGLVLNNDWTVGKPIIRTSAQTGGCFSCAYHVTRANGETAFLKAMDFAAALREPDPAKALNELTSAFLFERAILEECEQSIPGAWKSGKHKTLTTFPRPRRRRLSELNDSCAKLTLHWHKTSGRPLPHPGFWLCCCCPG